MTQPPVQDFDSTRFESIPDPLAAGAELPAPASAPSARPTRAEMKRRRRLSLLLGAGWIVAQLVVFGLRADLGALPAHHWVALGVGPLVGAGVCLVAAYSGGRLGTGLRVASLAALALAFPLALFVAGFALSSEATPGTLEDAAYCFNLMLAWAALPLVAAAFALRRSFVGRAGFRGALVGIAAGLAAASVVNLHCSVSDAVHMTVGHGLAVVVTALAGAFVLDRAVRV